jgi:hypothetical protein
MIGTSRQPAVRAEAASSGPPTAPLHLHQAIAVLGTLCQAALVANAWLRGSSQLLWPAAIVVAAMAVVAATTLVPAFYWRHRHVFMTLGRVVIYLVPSFRQTGVGLLAAMLLGPWLWTGCGKCRDTTHAEPETRLAESTCHC